MANLIESILPGSQIIYPSGTDDFLARFPCSAGTGTTTTDKYGNFGTMTRQGTMATPFSTKPGFFTGNGTDTFLDIPVTLAPRLDDNMAFLYACRFYRSADASGTNESLWDLGTNSIVGGAARLEITPTGAARYTARGVAETTEQAQTFTGFDMTSYNGVATGVALALLLHSHQTSDFTGQASLYVNGVLTDTLSVDYGSGIGATAFPLVPTGFTNAYRVGARATTGAVGLYITQSLGNAAVGDLLFYRQNEYNATVMSKVIY